MAEESKKMKLEVEFDRDEVVGTMMLMREKLTDERWAELTKAPISMDFKKFGADAVEVRIALIAIAIASADDLK